jgi:hypothetical protein
MGGCLSGFKSKPDKTREKGAPRGSTMNQPANTLTDTVLMDIGVKEKNDVYDRDLKARQMASTAALEEFTSQQKRNDKDSRPAATVTATDTATTTDTAADTTTTLDTATDTALTNVETISQDTFGENRNFVGNAGSGASVGTAAGGAAQAAAASATSVGPAEDEAIDLMKKGRRSTILTTPGGLLGSGEEDKKTRRRRSLIG